MNIWNSVWTILAALLMLCILVVVHELGHFGMGRLFGFQIDEFAVGFGPKLFSRKGKKGTVFSLRLFPIGGFCRFHGEDQEGKEDPSSFNNQAAWKRLLVLLGGPTANIVFAFLLAVAILGVQGAPLPAIYSVQVFSPAADAGLEAGDVILKINQQDALSYRIAKQFSSANPDGVDMEVLRDGTEKNIFVPNIYNAELQKNYLGITMQNSDYTQRFTVWNILPNAAAYMWNISVEMLKGLASIFLHPSTIATQATGPIGTVSVIQQGINSGIMTTLLLAMVISLNLGLFNLLPFPALDGSRIVFSLIEIIFRKPVPRNVEGAIHLLGFACLMMLIIWVTYGDFMRIIKG